MNKVQVINSKGKKVETIDLDPSVFDGKINKAIIHQAVVMYLANQRKGLASTKTKGQVQGGGRKPWRQKGTGRARVGSIRSPLWRGGGITFGPKPHSYRKKFPKTMKAQAAKSALNAKIHDKELLILDKSEVKSHKTKEFAQILKNLKIDAEMVRFVIDAWTQNLKLSHRNIKNVKLTKAEDLNTYEILDCKRLIFTKNAIRNVQERIKRRLQ